MKRREAVCFSLWQRFTLINVETLASIKNKGRFEVVRKTQHRSERAERVGEKLSSFCCDSWTVETVRQTASRRERNTGRLFPFKRTAARSGGQRREEPAACASQWRRAPLTASEQVQRTVRMSGEGRGGKRGGGAQKDRGAFAQRSLIKK